MDSVILLLSQIKGHMHLRGQATVFVMVKNQLGLGNAVRQLPGKIISDASVQNLLLQNIGQLKEGIISFLIYIYWTSTAINNVFNILNAT